MGAFVYLLSTGIETDTTGRVDTTGHVVQEIPQESKQIIKISVLAPLTGVRAEAGNYLRRGVLLAQKDINAIPRNKYVFELIFEDTQYDPRQSVTAYTKVRDIDNVHYIIGPYGSSEVLAVAPLAEKDKILTIIPAAQASEISLMGDYIFRTQINVMEEAPFWAEYLSKRIDEKLYIIAINTDYSVSYLKPFLEVYNKTNAVGSIQYFDSKESDFRTYLLKLKKLSAKHLFILGSPRNVGQIIKQSRELGYSMNYYGPSPMEGQELIQIAGYVNESIIYPYPYDDKSQTDSMLLYKHKYTKEYDSGPEMISANGYDSLMILSLCIERYGDYVDDVKNCIYTIKNYTGASGILTFDKNGDVTKPLIVKTVKGDKFVKYDD
jgi:branched-chain amino acid transport system substrate-binding protein